MADINDRTFKFAIEVIKFVKTLPSEPTSWEIGKQLVRSATSIGANIQEGRGASSRREYKKYYEVSLKSSIETIYWLKLLGETGVNRSDQGIVSLLDEAQQINRIVAASVISLKKTLRQF